LADKLASSIDDVASAIKESVSAIKESQDQMVLEGLNTHQRHFLQTAHSMGGFVKLHISRPSSPRQPARGLVYSLWYSRGGGILGKPGP
jgi:heme-degrading monooxygenase HmoA